MEKGIFVSYSHTDTEKVDSIIPILKDVTDMPVWYDNSLRYGDEFFGVIADQILQNDYFIFVVSEHSVQSDWCMHELEFAMSEKKKILALFIEDVTLPPRVRLIISNTHYIQPVTFSDEELREIFKNSILENNLEITDCSKEEDDKNNRGILETKYFVKESDKSKIRKCLEYEKKGLFSKCFTPENSLLLGIAYETGLYTETDLKKAEFYYTIGMYKKNKDAEFLYHMLSVKDETALTMKFINQMTELANQGSVMAMVYWGEELYFGKRGVPQNKKQAYQWWKTAADMGNAHAKYNMAYGYMNGETVEKNIAVALMYALESSEENFARAFRIIGAVYSGGEFFPKDETTAEKYFLKAIQFCDYFCYTLIGNIKYKNQEYNKAFEMYQKAVAYADEEKIKNGYPYYNLAWCYEYSDKKDMDTAFTYYLKAAERNHKNAVNEIAKKIYYETSMDTDKKLEFLKEASRLNCPKADYCIGRIYEQQQNRTLSTLWFEKGADKGDIFCIAFLLKRYAIAFPDAQQADGAVLVNRREKALEYFQLFFSLYNSAYKDIDDKLEYSFDVYYYAYAIELDIDEFGQKPDRIHSMYYYRKCLDYPGGTYHFNNISSIAFGYLIPKETGNMLFRDISHSIALTDLLYEYLDKLMADTKVEKSRKRLAVTRLITIYENLITADSENKKSYAKKIRHLEAKLKLLS